MERGDHIGFAAFKEALLRVAPQPAKTEEEIIEDKNDLIVAHTSTSSHPPSVRQEDPGANPPDAQALVYSDYFGPDITFDTSFQPETSTGEEDATDLQEQQRDSDEEIEEDPAAERSGDDMNIDDTDEDEAMSIYPDTPPTSTRKRQGSPLSEETTPAKQRYRRV